MAADWRGSYFASSRRDRRELSLEVLTEEDREVPTTRSDPTRPHLAAGDFRPSQASRREPIRTTRSCLRPRLTARLRAPCARPRRAANPQKIKHIGLRPRRHRRATRPRSIDQDDENADSVDQSTIVSQTHAKSCARLAQGQRQIVNPQWSSRSRRV